MLACDVGDLKMVDLLLRSNADSDLQQPVGIQRSYNEGQSHIISRWADYKLHCKWASKVDVIAVQGIIKVMFKYILSSIIMYEYAENWIFCPDASC